jgi:transposase-like protein
MSTELSEIRAQIESCRRDVARRRRFSEALKSRIACYASTRRESGETIQQLSEVLGISENQLYRWMRQNPDPQTGFLPVRVVEHRGAVLEQAVMDMPMSSALRLVSPAGWRVEGLDLQALSMLLARLP